MAFIDVYVFVVLFLLLAVSCFCCVPCMAACRRKCRGKQHEASGYTSPSSGDVETGNVPKPAPASGQQRGGCKDWGGKRWALAVGQVALAALAAYLILCAIIAAYVAAFEDSLTFEPVSSDDCVMAPTSDPDDCIYTPPAWVTPITFLEHSFSLSDGTVLDGFYFENSTFPDGQTEWVNILYNHGSGANIAAQYRWDRYQFLTSLGGVRMFVYDYAGYGRSQGSPSFDSVKASAEAALAYFQDTWSLELNETTLLGRSLGGGVAAFLAHEAPSPRAMIMQSTFASLKETAANGFPLTRWVIESVYGVDFDSVDNLSMYRNCFLQTHSEADETVPVEDGKKLFDSITTTNPACRQWLEVQGLDHQDPLSVPEMDALTAFVNSYARAP